MAQKQDSNYIKFLAEYEDGKTEYFFIDRFTLQRGDHVATHIARERQGKRQLSEGKIISVRRAQ